MYETGPDLGDLRTAGRFRGRGVELLELDDDVVDALRLELRGGRDS